MPTQSLKRGVSNVTIEDTRKRNSVYYSFSPTRPYSKQRLIPTGAALKSYELNKD
jgi:hypothetical protein